MNKHMNLTKMIALAIFTSLGLFASSASADTLNISFEGDGGISLTATLDGTTDGFGTFTATSGTGVVTGSPGGLGDGAVTLLANPNAPSASVSPFGSFVYDDLVFPGQDPLLNNNGLLFVQGGNELNIFGNGASVAYSYYLSNSPGNYPVIQNGSFAAAVVPVPPAVWGGLTLLGGLATAGIRARRRQLA